MDKGVFSIAVGFNVPRIPLSEGLFERAIGPCAGGVCAQIVAYSEMTTDVMGILHTKDMYLMRTRRAALAQIAAAGNAEFSHDFVTKTLECVVVSVYRFSPVHGTAVLPI